MQQYLFKPSKSAQKLYTRKIETFFRSFAIFIIAFSNESNKRAEA